MKAAGAVCEALPHTVITTPAAKRQFAVSNQSFHSGSSKFPDFIQSCLHIHSNQTMKSTYVCSHQPALESLSGSRNQEIRQLWHEECQLVAWQHLATTRSAAWRDEIIADFDRFYTGMSRYLQPYSAHQRSFLENCGPFPSTWSLLQQNKSHAIVFLFELPFFSLARRWEGSFVVWKKLWAKRRKHATYVTYEF